MSDLARFVTAQADGFDRARAELAAGRKRTHWMWWVFPQLRGLGRSETTRHYGIADLEEARAYDRHATLGPRLHDCAALLLTHPDTPIATILGEVDALKSRSCATLFEAAAADPAVFAEVLEVHHGGTRCTPTLTMLEDAR